MSLYCGRTGITITKSLILRLYGGMGIFFCEDVLSRDEQSSLLQISSARGLDSQEIYDDDA